MAKVFVVYSTTRFEPRRWCYDAPDASPLLPLVPGESLLEIDHPTPQDLAWVDMALHVADNAPGGTGVPARTQFMCDVIQHGTVIATIAADPAIDTLPGVYLQRHVPPDGG